MAYNYVHSFWIPAFCICFASFILVCINSYDFSQGRRHEWHTSVCHCVQASKTICIILVLPFCAVLFILDVFNFTGSACCSKSQGEETHSWSSVQGEQTLPLNRQSPLLCVATDSETHGQMWPSQMTFKVTLYVALIARSLMLDRNIMQELCYPVFLYIYIYFLPRIPCKYSWSKWHLLSQSSFAASNPAVKDYLGSLMRNMSMTRWDPYH